MCGIAGFVTPSGLGSSASGILTAMTDAIARRGPDDAGQWLDARAGVALGHRRLSIIDLSPGGHQPMVSADQRFVLTYNGEIYNFQTLRAELQAEGAAQAWRGSSDTEVLLAAIRAWGVDRALARAEGMFAFALWDSRERTLTLARDAMGEKPLYYGWQGRGSARTLLFGSDLAALRRHPAFAAAIDPEAIGLMLRYLHVPDPWSAYRGICKVMPGTYVVVRPADGQERSVRYWDTLTVAAEGVASPFEGDADAAVDNLERVLGDAVERQMVSDVPLGAFLSGGVDSSSIVALMQARSGRPIKTFTVGFEEAGYNEADHARAVARHLGTDHTERVVTAADALQVIPQLPSMFSEPFAVPSQIPTYIISRLAREQVTVSLSGDGGDELFGGYNRHLYSHRYWKQIARVPQPLRAVMSPLISGISPEAWDRLLGRFLQGQVSAPGDKIHKVAGAIGSRTADDLYHTLLSPNTRPDRLMGRSLMADGFAAHDLDGLKAFSAAERMMALDAVHYLPGDVLTKVDRAAMHTSLETRVPMLDPAVVRLAWQMPLDLKIRGGVSKWVLREVLYRHVPKTLIERPKMGFRVPIGPWLRNELRDWAEDLLSPSALSSSGLFDPVAVRVLWDRHLSGTRNHDTQLWPILMVQAWLQSLSPSSSMRQVENAGLGASSSSQSA